MNNNFLIYIIFLVSVLLFLLILINFNKFNYFKNFNVFKVSFLPVIIILLFYKLEFIFLAKTLSAYWMLPLVYGTSAVLILVTRYHIISTDNSYHSIEVKKLAYLFVITFISTALFTLLIYYTDGYIDDLIHLLNLNFGFTMIIGYSSPSTCNDIYTLKMNKPSDKDLSNVPVQQSGESSSSNSDEALNEVEHVNKILRLSDLRQESHNVRARMQKLINDVNKIKSDNDLQVIETSDGSLGVELPNEVDDAKARFLSNKIGVIDGVFNGFCDRIEGIFKECDTICEQIKGYNRSASAQAELVEKRKLQYRQTVEEYKNLIDEA